MCPAGYLGNHAAVPGVNFILRVSDGRENPTFPFQHRSTRIVARSFNGKKNSTRFCVSSSYHDQRIFSGIPIAVSYTHLRAHETDSYLVCRLLLEKKKKK